MSSSAELIDAVFNNIEKLKLLLAVPGVDVNIQDEDGETAVHFAARENNTEALKLLINHTSSSALILNQKYKQGRTPAMLAVLLNQLEAVAILCADPRVDLDTTDNKGQSLEDRARCAFLFGFLKSSKMLESCYYYYYHYHLCKSLSTFQRRCSGHYHRGQREEKARKIVIFFKNIPIDIFTYF